MEKRIASCLIVDDTPATPAYWVRLQQTAFGQTPNEATAWGRNWRSLAPAGLWRVRDARDFADLAEEFDLRGKFTFLPCPAGLGRIDHSVRGYSDHELKELVAITRDRLQPRMDITPEVLTHGMALELRSGGLLPHAESHWLSYLCATRQMEALDSYLRHGWTILRNVGIEAHGLTMGGMSDGSGISQGKSLLDGHHRDVLGKAVLAVEKDFSPNRRNSFIYTGSPPVTEEGKKRRVPEVVYQGEEGIAFDIYAQEEDPLLPVLHGNREILAQTTDAMISPDLARGKLVEDAEAGRAVVFTVHSQTLCALHTGIGLQILREALRRFQERFGKRIEWLKASELCGRFGVGVKVG